MVNRDGIRWPADSGATLLELLVVLAVLALVTALAAPALRGSSTTDLAAVTSALASDLQEARNEAMRRQTETSLHIDTQRRTIETFPGPRQRPLPAGVGIDLIAAKANVRGQAGSAIGFFPDGSSTGGRITLKRGADNRTSEVDWRTGRIAVEGEP